MDFWTYDGGLYLSVYYKHGYQFGRYLDGKFEPAVLPDVAGRTFDAQNLVTVKEGALLLGRIIDPDDFKVADPAAFLLEGGKWTKVKFVGTPTSGQFTKLVHLGEDPMLVGEGSSSHCHVWRDRQLQQLTLSDGSESVFLASADFREDADGQVVCSRFDIKKRKRLEYLLEGTVFQPTKPPSLPDGAAANTVKRRFSKLGAIVAAEVNNSTQVWFEKAGERQPLVGSDGKELELLDPEITAAGGDIYVYGPNPKPYLYRIKDGSTAEEVHIADESWSGGTYLASCGGVAVLWADGRPSLLDGTECRPLITNYTPEVSSILVQVGEYWLGSRQDSKSGTRYLLVISESVVTELKCPTKLYVSGDYLEGLVFDGTLFVVLSAGATKSLVRRDGNELTPLMVKDLYGGDDVPASAASLKVAVADNKLIVRTGANVPYVRRIWRE